MSYTPIQFMDAAPCLRTIRAILNYQRDPISTLDGSLRKLTFTAADIGAEEGCGVGFPPSQYRV